MITQAFELQNLWKSTEGSIQFCSFSTSTWGCDLIENTISASVLLHDLFFAAQFKSRMAKTSRTRQGKRIQETQEAMSKWESFVSSWHRGILRFRYYNSGTKN